MVVRRGERRMGEDFDLQYAEDQPKDPLMRHGSIMVDRRIRRTDSAAGPVTAECSPFTGRWAPPFGFPHYLTSGLNSLRASPTPFGSVPLSPWHDSGTIRASRAGKAERAATV